MTSRTFASHLTARSDEDLLMSFTTTFEIDPKEPVNPVSTLLGCISLFNTTSGSLLIFELRAIVTDGGGCDDDN